MIIYRLKENQVLNFEVLRLMPNPNRIGNAETPSDKSVENAFIFLVATISVVFPRPWIRFTIPAKTKQIKIT